MSSVLSNGIEVISETAKEKCLQILRCMASGDSLKKAAGKVGWQYQTAKNHLHLFKKSIGAVSLFQAYAMCFESLLTTKGGDRTDTERTRTSAAVNTPTSRAVGVGVKPRPTEIREHRIEKDDYSQ